MQGGGRVWGGWGQEQSRPLRPTWAYSQGCDGPQRHLLVKEASGLGSALGADGSSRFLNDVCFFSWRNWWFSAASITPLETLEVSGGIWVVSAFGGWWVGRCWHLVWKPGLLLEILGCLGPTPHSRGVTPRSQMLRLSNLVHPWLQPLRSHPDPLMMKAQRSIQQVSWVPITLCWSPEVSSFLHLELP